MKNLYIYKGIHIEWETEEELATILKKVDLAEEEYLNLINGTQSTIQEESALESPEATEVEEPTSDESISNDASVQTKTESPATEVPVTDSDEGTDSEKVVTPTKTIKTRRNR